jgi:hypothetical protein
MGVGLPVSRLISATVNLQAVAAQTANFNTALILGSSAVIDVVSRIRTYTSLTAIATDFGTSAPEYLAAQAWFNQSPQPTTLTVGRWAKTASKGQLICGVPLLANQAVSGWTGVTAGSLKVTVDTGLAQTVTGLNFSAQTTMAGVASIIQAGITGVVVTWDAVYKRFVITSNTTGATSAISFLTAAGSGTDITAMMMGLATSSGAYVANGIALETALAAVTIFDTRYSDQWYGLAIPEAVDADHTAVAGYIEGTVASHMYAVTHAESAVLNSGDTSNISYVLQQLGYNHTFTQYSSSNAYAAISLLARMLTTIWTGNNTAITAMYKQEPGVVAETLTTTQIANLESYYCNVFVAYNNATNIIENGKVASGQYIDTIIGVDWIKATVQTNVYNLLYTSTTKIPQTDGGMNQIATVIEAACQQGVANGLLAPGPWSGGGFGQIKQGDYLSKGFYVYTPPISSQPASQRANRLSVPFQIAARLAGAVHTASLTINVAS